jgi:hypothetical protein
MAGVGTRLLKLEIDGEEVSAQVSRAVITTGEADSDFVTFAQAAAGGARQYNLEMTAVQDPTTDTVWDRVWSAAGSTVPCTLMLYGNETPSVAQPHYEFNAVIAEPDGDFIGGEADVSTTARMTIEVVWPLESKPTKVTA